MPGLSKMLIAVATFGTLRDQHALARHRQVGDLSPVSSSTATVPTGTSSHVRTGVAATVRASPCGREWL